MAGKKRRSLDADSENSDPLYRARHSLAHLMATKRSASQGDVAHLHHGWRRTSALFV
jgi:hypothetical protein